MVVLVPDARGVEAFAGVAEVEPLIWDLKGRAPVGAERAEVVVTRHMDPDSIANQLGRLPNLRVVQLFSAGREGWIDALPEDVLVSGADRVHGGPVAEWVVAQLLAYYRQLDEYRAQQRSEAWERRWTGTLADKKVLVLGAGDIGEHVMRRLDPFGARVTLASRNARRGVIDLLQARKALPGYDIVVLALPLTADTHQIVDSKFLAAMKDGSVLVNVGRGPLIDTDALIIELLAERLTAVLDVTDPEPLPPGHPLWTAPGVVITPHSAALTHDTVDRCWSAIVRNVGGFARSNIQGAPGIRARLNT